MFRPSRCAATAFVVCLGSLSAVPAGAGPGDVASKTPQVTSLWLADATTDALIGEITEGASFDSDDLSTELTVVAKVNQHTESVQFGNAIELVVQTENFEPYAMNGDLNGDLAPSDLKIGTNVVRVTPYGADDAAGAKGKELLVSFSIRPSTYRVNTTADGHDAEPGDGVCSTAQIDHFASRQAATAEPNDRRLAAPSVGTASLGFDRSTTSRCTLRAAIEETNAQTGWQRILVPNMTDDYQVDLGDLDVTDTVQIDGEDVNTGPGTWPAPRINANGSSRIFNIEDAGPVTLSWLQIVGGDAGDGRGGGIWISNAPVTIKDSIIVANRANIGGGIYAQSTLISIERSVIQYNTAGHPDDASGGGQTQRGGGLAVIEGGAIIEESTIEGNRAVRGAGIYLANAMVQTTNVEVVGNEANTRGGGFEFVKSTGQLTFTTIADNTAGTSTLDGPQDQVGGGMVVDGSTVEMANSILANNTGAFEPGNEFFSPDCYTIGGDASIVSRRGNVLGTLSDNCDFADHELGFALTDAIGFEDAPLDPGFGFVDYLLDAGSPAIDNATFDDELSFFNCPSTDRGGFTTRAQGPACDSGAWERIAG